MSSTWLNEILKNENLSIEEKEKMINAHYKEEDKDKENMEKGYFDSPAFENDKKRIYEQCEAEYKEIWNKLETESKDNLHSAYFYDRFGNKINDDESSTILKFCKTVENEIRAKILIKFVPKCTIGDANFNNSTDKIFRGCIKNYKDGNGVILTLGQMLTLIKESCYSDTESHYADELYHFLDEDYWDVDFLYDCGEKNDFYLDYPKQFRNDSAHVYIYDKKLTKACKKETKDILSWLMSSYRSGE